MSALLSLQNVVTEFNTPRGKFRAVDRVSFDLQKGKTLCLVGESGCGKSMTALTLMRLVPEPAGNIIAGQIFFDGQNLLSLKSSQMRKIRGKRMAMIFQEPMTALNPVLTVMSQIREMFTLHQPTLSKLQVRRRILELLDWVGIPDPQDHLTRYPHQLSGGMRQRVMIAMALSCNPDLLIADEPTTALDVTIQAQILELIARIQQEFHMSLLLITHDLGVVAQIADEVVIMYAGMVVEKGSVEDIFDRTQHPYTYGLMKSTADFSKGALKRLHTIPGQVPDLKALPRGCRFFDRCAFRVAACQEAIPSLLSKDQSNMTHQVACIRPRVWED